MAGTRALFASIGASVVLVVAAALALLAVSAVFAFGGWTDSVSRSSEKAPLVFADSNLAQAGGTQTTAASDAGTRIVAPAPERRPDRGAAAEREPVARSVPSADTVVARVSSGRGVPPVSQEPEPEPQPAAPSTSTKSGDRVRKVGESLSSTVQNTGDALAQATQPLAPPVSEAVQQVLNIVAELVRRTTGGLSNTLDTLLPPKQ
jgi:hypothetical protein